MEKINGRVELLSWIFIISIFIFINFI
jgi:hypothetical protein